MRYSLVLMLLSSLSAHCQRWGVEVAAGAAGYSGDLTEKIISLRTIGAAAGVTVKYHLRNEMLVFRAGATWSKISGDDKHNRQPDLRARNLSFSTHLWELSLCAELNLLEPDLTTLYPYVFIGGGVFRFNPYAFDDQHKKHFLQPLGTEGQGLAEYPDRQPYSLTQFCIPMGGGLKINLGYRSDLVYEFGARVLFTDYLDDVSKTYADRAALLANSRPDAASLSYRYTRAPFPAAGDTRGNPGNNDWYFISALKWLFRFGK